MTDHTAPATTLKQLFYDADLVAGTSVDTPKTLARRLSRVLRYRAGDALALFNGRDGRFAARVANDDASRLDVLEQLAPQPQPLPIWLLMGLPKRDAMDTICRQATEMGVTHIVPVAVDHSVPDRINADRVQALVIEAAEQCERLTLPQVLPLTHLADALQLVPGAVLWADERLARGGGNAVWQSIHPAGGWGVLVGPEGGFSAAERALLDAAAPKVCAVDLGENVLRADTAACALLSRLFMLAGH